MYAGFFGLRELPFNNTPDPRFFYSTPDHEEALASLVYAVRERKGFVLLTGEIGAGKTLVSRMMLRQFGNEIAFANINHALQNTNDLMESLCAEFEIEVEPDATPTTLVRKLHDFLLDRFARNIPVVLILDEAQNLPTETFEQLRMIGNLEADDAKLLQIAIVGQPELQQKFQSPQLRQLRQRVFRSFHLPALSRESTEQYIRHRLSVAGATDQDTFESTAIDRIWSASRGLPRLINTLCDNAMLSAFSADVRRIDAPFIESVVRQMMLVEGHGRAGSVAIAQPAGPAVQRATQPMAGPIRSKHRLELPEPLAAVEVLSNRVKHLELLLERGPQSSPRNEPPRQQDDAIAAAVRQAGSIQAHLKPLIDQAQAAAHQAESADRALQARQQRLQTYTSELRQLMVQLREVQIQLDQSVARSRNAEQSARTMHDRMIQQFNQSFNQAMRLAQSKVAVQPRSPVLQYAETPSSPPVRNATSVLAQGHHAVANERKAARLEELLMDTRTSLGELRLLSQGPAGTSRSARAKILSRISVPHS